MPLDEIQKAEAERQLALREPDAIIRDTREMIDETHRNVTGKPASDDAVMLSLATQVHLARKALAVERETRRNAEQVCKDALAARTRAEADRDRARHERDQLRSVLAN